MVSEKLLTKCSATGETLLYDRGLAARLFIDRGQQFDHHLCLSTVLDKDLPLPIGICQSNHLESSIG
jgi:hypothetical protein